MGRNTKQNKEVMVKGYWMVSVDISNPESHKMYVAETCFFHAEARQPDLYPDTNTNFTVTFDREPFPTN